MASELLRLLFPPRCMFCGALLPRGVEEVCEDCRRAVLLSEAPPKSGKGMFYAQAVAALPYDGAVRKAIQRFKFSGRQSYARPLARMMAHALETRMPAAFDVVSFVPTNAHNLRVRGYDHAELLARELAAFTGKPYLAALKKTRRTRPMFDLKPAERRANVLGAFTLACPPALVQGKVVLLADDVLTTGATVSECARTLLEAGAERVYAVAAAAPAKARAETIG